jgi:hypothetical protein
MRFISLRLCGKRRTTGVMSVIWIVKTKIFDSVEHQPGYKGFLVVSRERKALLFLGFLSLW